jgi:putative DNA primase/helicase
MRMVEPNQKQFAIRVTRLATGCQRALGEGVSFEYFILTETFKAEVCQGFDHRTVARVLLDHGCLIPDKGRAFDCRPRLPGIGNTWCYRIPPAIFELDL